MVLSYGKSEQLPGKIFWKFGKLWWPKTGHGQFQQISKFCLSHHLP